MVAVNRTWQNHRQNIWLANKGTIQIEPWGRGGNQGDDDEAKSSCSNKKSHPLVQLLPKVSFQNRSPLTEEEAGTPGLKDPATHGD